MKIIAAIRHHGDGGAQVLFRGQDTPEGMEVSVGLKRAHNEGCIFPLASLHEHDGHAPFWFKKYTEPDLEEDDTEVEAPIPTGKSMVDDMAGYICRVLQDVVDGTNGAMGAPTHTNIKGPLLITLRLIDGAGNMAEGGEKFENLLQACEASAKSEAQCAVVLTWGKEKK